MLRRVFSDTIVADLENQNRPLLGVPVFGGAAVETCAFPSWGAGGSLPDHSILFRSRTRASG